MIALAVEMSSRQGSLALLEDGALWAEQVWMDEGMRSQNVFHVFSGLLKETGLTPGDVALFIVGRGPGSYTGLRVAVTAAQALALPRGDPVYALGSGVALAAEQFAADPAERMAVVGDARREQLWVGSFRRGRQEEEVEGGESWTLVQPEQLPDYLSPGCLAVSPDWEKKKDLFVAARRPEVRWIERDVFPRAGWLGRVGWRRLQNGIPSEPLSPIYLHDAVMK